MSFWAGIVKGMEANDAERKDEDDRAERKEIRAEDVAWREKMHKAAEARELRQEERDAQTRALETAWREKKFDQDADHFLQTMGIQIERFDYEKDQNEINRLQDLAEKYPSLVRGVNGVRTPGGGGGGINSDKEPTPREIEEQTLLFIDGIGGRDNIENLTEPNREIVEAVLANPAASVGIMALATSQRLKGNNFDLTKLSEYINYAGVMEGTGDKEARDAFIVKFQKSQQLGTPLEAKEILDGVAALSSYTPSKVIWSVGQIDENQKLDAKELNATNNEIARVAVSLLSREINKLAELATNEGDEDKKAAIEAERNKLMLMKDKYNTSDYKDTALFEMRQRYGPQIKEELIPLGFIDTEVLERLLPTAPEDTDTQGTTDTPEAIVPPDPKQVVSIVPEGEDFIKNTNEDGEVVVTFRSDMTVTELNRQIANLMKQDPSITRVVVPGQNKVFDSNGAVPDAQPQGETTTNDTGPQSELHNKVSTLLNGLSDPATDNGMIGRSLENLVEQHGEEVIDAIIKDIKGSDVTLDDLGIQ